MLLEFRVTNYKSFREEFVFSLVPAPKQKGLDYSVMKMQAGNKEYKGLCSAVVYGPNASGKTNIIGAMNTFKSIVLRGNIRNDPKYNGANYAAGMLELIPNNASSKSEPVAFSITFIEAGLLIEYAFSMDLGAFLASGFKRKILLETLKVDKNLVFSRDEEMEFGSLDTVQEFLLTALEQNKPGAEAIARSGLNDEELFLTNGFKMIFSAKLVSLITDWIDKKFTVVCRADAIVSEPQISGNQKEPVYFEKTVNELAGRLGAPGALGYVIDSKNGHPRLYSWFKSKNNNKGRGIPAEVFESYGTLRFINLFPLIAGALVNGGILVVDEFDASIHPMALMNIINIFHNDAINIYHAQLVFNTHNPIFLNANLFRRDEIKFVERDEDTHLSTLYALSDFKTAGKNGARKGQDYMKNYFMDRYGAIKDVDFAPIFQDIIKTRKPCP